MPRRGRWGGARRCRRGPAGHRHARAAPRSRDLQGLSPQTLPGVVEQHARVCRARPGVRRHEQARPARDARRARRLLHQVPRAHGGDRQALPRWPQSRQAARQRAGRELLLLPQRHRRRGRPQRDAARGERHHDARPHPQAARPLRAPGGVLGDVRGHEPEEHGDVRRVPRHRDARAAFTSNARSRSIATASSPRAPPARRRPSTAASAVTCRGRQAIRRLAAGRRSAHRARAPVARRRRGRSPTFPIATPSAAPSRTASSERASRTSRSRSRRPTSSRSRSRPVPVTTSRAAPRKTGACGSRCRPTTAPASGSTRSAAAIIADGEIEDQPAGDPQRDPHLLMFRDRIYDAQGKTRAHVLGSRDVERPSRRATSRTCSRWRRRRTSRASTPCSSSTACPVRMVFRPA